MKFINSDDIIIQNGTIIPLSENENHYVFQSCTDKWITKEGEEIEIQNMTNLHIENSLKMIERTCKLEGLNVNNYRICKLLKEELKKRTI